MAEGEGGDSTELVSFAPSKTTLIAGGVGVLAVGILVGFLLAGGTDIAQAVLDELEDEPSESDDTSPGEPESTGDVEEPSSSGPIEAA